MALVSFNRIGDLSLQSDIRSFYENQTKHNNEGNSQGPSQAKPRDKTSSKGMLENINYSSHILVIIICKQGCGRLFVYFMFLQLRKNGVKGLGSQMSNFQRLV